MEFQCLLSFQSIWLTGLEFLLAQESSARLLHGRAATLPVFLERTFHYPFFSAGEVAAEGWENRFFGAHRQIRVYPRPKMCKMCRNLRLCLCPSALLLLETGLTAPVIEGCTLCHAGVVLLSVPPPLSPKC